ncbi:MAG: outer membrane beta-barrel protein [Gammaproteobacteria bacterium]|nr:outer membrane beta-barrel protein [Gammaproteobacteria bacterium]
MNRNSLRSLKTAAAASFALAAPLALASPAVAGSTASNELRLGAYLVFYDSSADDLSGPFVPPGVNLKVQNVQTLYAAYIRRLSPHVLVELAFGWPPLTKTQGKGPAALGSVPYNGVVISTARWVSPTLLLNYEFGDPNARLRPYVGLGVNYTTFIDRQSTAAGNAASGGPTQLSLSASVGPAATVGLSYRIAPHWHAYASYAYAQIESDLTANTAGEIRKTHVNFRPSSIILSVGYSF